MSRLRERLKEVQAAEEDDRRRVAYEDARTERDQLAAELARVYPPLAAQLADLLGRLRASACEARGTTPAPPLIAARERWSRG